MDEKGDPSPEEAPKVIKPTSKEFRKTWGFRRTTIAKREGAGDAELDPEQQPQQQSLSLRRSGRQPKRTERVEEFLTTVRRRGRRSAPVSLEDPGELASCPATDAETASEGSVESGPPAGPAGARERPASASKAKGEADEDDSSDSDSDGLTLKELQNRLRRKREQEPADRPLRGVQSRLRKRRREEDPPAAEQAAKDDPENTLEGKAARGGPDGAPGGSVRHKPECEVYDPSALYCMCRQPHNNRFMICCDRCEEWFHGDCVGISEARGRLLERNGEDYICPNCTILQVQDEPSAEATDRPDTRCRPVDADGTDCTSIGTIEQKSSEDQGIKGRIEKAANPSGKKKLKIFQPVAEAPGAARCIGPGCSSVAQPDSVYCSNDCILKHAAATMQFLRSGKEPKPKPKEKTKAKAEKLTLPKGSAQAGIKISSVHKRAVPDKKESTLKKAVAAPARGEVPTKDVTCESSTPSWASDHNYNAVKPEQTAAPWPSLLCKSVKDNRHTEDNLAAAAAPKKVVPPGSLLGGKQPSPRSLLPKKSPFVNVAGAKAAIRKVPPGFKGTMPRRPWLSTTPSGAASTAKQARLVPGTAASASRTLPGSAAVGAARKPMATSVPLASPAPGRLGPSSPAPSQPNSQIRQNIRRSLKEILWKRVSDSDDLIMTESEVGRVALRIEKELFNLFRVTDNRYKSKYRSLMFNLKDPKNQGLFHRVLREEISLAKLVRMKPEELVSKELSVWKERPTRPVMEPRAKFLNESRKTAVRQEAVPDMEDSPPVSDSDEQESVRAVPESSAAPLLDVFSSMLKDTTSQHRAHLFDLNCKICTGQVPSSEDEPAPKRQKLAASKKEESKPKHDSPPSEPAVSSPDEVVPETVPENASEPDPGGASEAPLERKCPPGPPGDSHPEPSTLEGPSGLASCGGGVLTTVTMSGRDPRTAQSGASTVMTPAAAHPETTPLAEPRQDVPKPAVASVLVPKSILAKPSSSPEPRYLLSVPPSPSISVAESRSPPEGDTALFLSRLSAIWKGFINMQSVAKFVTKAYPVSGCFDYLSEDLPDTIHVGGRIAPRTVWDYVGKLKSSVSKELCLIRFHPATEEEEVAYISLYSYFSSRGRFGVVANNSRRVKDLYLIPLGAEDPVPSKLLPFEGPGLESPRPNIILGLVICQKMKRPLNAGELDKVEEKRARLPLQEDVDVPVYPRTPAAPQPEKKPPKYQPCSGDSAVGTTPPGAPPPPPPPPAPPPAAAASSSVLKILSTLKPGATNDTAAPPAPAVAAAAASPATCSASKTASPLEHILQTLFGKKKSFDTAAKEPVEPALASAQDAKAKAEGGLPAVPLLDPIVQQFGQLSKEKAVEDEEDDRPYDPEEEYGPDRAFDTQLGDHGGRPDADRATESAEREEVAYDPEDETILEEAKVTVHDLPNRMCSDVRGGAGERPAGGAVDGAAPSLAEQQKMLEELSRQIEEQKRQVEEQEAALRQQRAAAGKGAPPPPFQGQREPAPRPLGMSGLHGPSFPGPRGPVPPFSEETAMSNSDGSRGPPAARFGAPKGPIPSLFSGPHGPPPYGDNRGPSPSHPGGPRGTAAPQFEERKDPHGEKREFQDSPYEMAGPATQFEGPEQGQFVGGRAAAPFQFGGPRRPLLSQFKGPRGGPPPSQFGGQRGPPPGHFVGPRGPHPSQFEGPRGQAPGFMPGPRGVQPPQFDEQRVTSPPPPRFANQRAPAPLQFAGPRGPAPFPEKNEPARFHFQGQAAPVSRSCFYRFGRPSLGLRAARGGFRTGAGPGRAESEQESGLDAGASATPLPVDVAWAGVPSGLQTLPNFRDSCRRCLMWLTSDLNLGDPHPQLCLQSLGLSQEAQTSA
ncbi:Death-inducer obliterator 1 [Pteropus alecto]|uniref:Death-inducer obliterator 1 n=1 Tax=Pteropus alecto TaxID=9402 RepID=L5JYL9_PTEAL|nr:Death-inducer obliterator 1 [Pteropus alecto]